MKKKTSVMAAAAATAMLMTSSAFAGGVVETKSGNANTIQLIMEWLQGVSAGTEGVGIGTTKGAGSMGNK